MPGGNMTKTVALMLASLVPFSGTVFAQPQVVTDFFNGRAHIIDNDIMDDAHTVEIALAGGSSGLMNVRAILISRWVTFDEKWNAVVQQAWGIAPHAWQSKPFTSSTHC